MNHKIIVVKCPMQKRRSCWGNILLKPPKSKCNKSSMDAIKLAYQFAQFNTKIYPESFHDAFSKPVPASQPAYLKQTVSTNIMKLHVSIL